MAILARSRLIARLQNTRTGAFASSFFVLLGGAFLAYLVNRLSNPGPTEVWQHWELYAAIAALMTSAAAQIARRRSTLQCTDNASTILFTGRQEELKAIERALRQDQAAVICGMRGVGKSVLAHEYALRNRDRYEMTWAFPATSEESIIEGFIALGTALFPDAVKIDDRKIAAISVRSNIIRKSSGAALLIFDDIRDENLLRRWKPTHGLDVIATSSRAAETWADNIVSIVPLTIWDEPTAVTYLRSASGNARLSAADARRIVQTLQLLPLAVAHAAAYLRMTAPTSADGYLKRLTAHLAVAPPDAEYPKSVFATFQEAIERAESEAKGAAAIMCFSSFFASERLPEAIFLQPLELYSDALQPMLSPGIAVEGLRSTIGKKSALEDALGALNRLSLMVFSRTDRTVSIHGLVQAAAQQLVTTNITIWATTAVAVIESLFPSGDVSTWNDCERLLPHARASLNALPDTEAFIPGGDLAVKCAIYLYHRGSIADAELLFRRGMSIHEAALGEEHPVVARDLSLLADLLRDTDDLDGAERAFRRALHLDRTRFGPENPIVGRDLSNLATVLHRKFHLEDAERALRCALKVSELYDQEALPTVLHRLAMVLVDRNDRIGAERFCRRAVSLAEAVHGAHSAAVAQSLTLLGDILRDSEPGRAEELYRRALAIEQRIYGANNSSVASTEHNLGSLLLRMGRYDEAESLLKDALSVDETIFGQGNVKVAKDLDTLARLFTLTSRLDEAETSFERALTVTKSALGAHHAEVAIPLNNFANFLSRIERYSEAEPLYRNALAIQQAVRRPNDPLIALTLTNLAQLLIKIDRIDEAAALCRTALGICRESCAEHDPVYVGLRRTMEFLLSRPQ